MNSFPQFILFYYIFILAEKFHYSFVGQHIVLIHYIMYINIDQILTTNNVLLIFFNF